MLVHSGIANDAGEITLIPVSMNTTQESKVESPVSLTAQSLIGASPKQTHLTKAQEVHPIGISKPKRTGSLALFYRKVCVFIASKKISFNQCNKDWVTEDSFGLFLYVVKYKIHYFNHF